MKTTTHPFPFICLLVGLCSLVGAATPALAAITIETTDGRIIHGEVDEQTDNALLWIRQETELMTLTTSVPWSAIYLASQAGEVLPLEQLPKLLRPQTTSAPADFLVQPVLYGFPVECPGDFCAVQTAGYASDYGASQYPPRHLPTNIRPAKVRSLEVEAYLVNLDRDVEPDGIEIFVTALDEFGQPVPVRGNLNIRLWGERVHPNGSHARHESLQQWNQTVRKTDFSSAGSARYSIRFRTVRPGFDLGLHPDALVQVRLGVWGQGNFAASVPVQIRHFNPFRDRLQHAQGSRYLRDELTEEMRHLDFERQHTRPHPVR